MNCRVSGSPPAGPWPSLAGLRRAIALAGAGMSRSLRPSGPRPATILARGKPAAGTPLWLAGRGRPSGLALGTPDLPADFVVFIRRACPFGACGPVSPPRSLTVGTRPPPANARSDGSPVGSCKILGWCGVVSVNRSLEIVTAYVGTVWDGRLKCAFS